MTDRQGTVAENAAGGMECAVDPGAGRGAAARSGVRRAAWEDGSPLLRRVVRATAWVGGPMFLLTVILHPARDGYSIASRYDWYELTHALEAATLLVQAACLAGVLALGLRRFGARGLIALYAALIGTVAWYGLIVFDGSHNSLAARFEPQLVHTSADLDLSGAVVLLAANLLFPLGYLLLGVLLHRHGLRWTGLLLATGGVVYSLGGTAAILGGGPHTMLTSILEVAGAVPYALGYLRLGRAFGPQGADPNARSTV